jgi:transcriptional regulator with XRE-family HTH domain
MAKKSISLDEMRLKRPVNESQVKKTRDSILAQSRAVRLADFRKSLEMTQTEIAEILGVDQSNISRIERGKFSNTEIGTLQAYVEALGGSLEIHARVGKKSHLLIDGEFVNSH